MYWIVKNGRVATCSYTGPTWDTANLRDKCKTEYMSYTEAQELADKLTESNPVGFHVKVAYNVKAIVYYSDPHYYEKNKDTKYKDFPIYSRVDFTLENILKLKELESQVIITDAGTLPTWAYWGESIFDDLELDDSHYDYLTSFTKEELVDFQSNPTNYIVLEVYNGYRE